MSFILGPREGRWYMWKQRLEHWAELLIVMLACCALLLGGYTVRGCIAERGRIRSAKAEAKRVFDEAHYQTWMRCDNCTRQFYITVPKGVPASKAAEPCMQCEVGTLQPKKAPRIR